MSFTEKLPTMEEAPMDEDQNFFLKNQVDAITRARHLLGKREPTKDYSINDVVKSLADAEERAQFMCGFVLLSKASDYITQLKNYLVENKYLNEDSKKYVSLTDKGTARSSTPLPDQIEACF